MHSPPPSRTPRPPHGCGLKGGDTHTHATRAAEHHRSMGTVPSVAPPAAAPMAPHACSPYRHYAVVCTTPASTRPYYPKWCWSDRRRHRRHAGPSVWSMRWAGCMVDEALVPCGVCGHWQLVASAQYTTPGVGVAGALWPARALLPATTCAPLTDARMWAHLTFKLYVGIPAAFIKIRHIGHMANSAAAAEVPEVPSPAPADDEAGSSGGARPPEAASPFERTVHKEQRSLADAAAAAPPPPPPTAAPAGVVPSPPPADGGAGSSSGAGAGSAPRAAPPAAASPFECNICFESATSPVVSLCGHLYWCVVGKRRRARIDGRAR
jgi:hypothetical protein